MTVLHLFPTVLTSKLSSHVSVSTSSSQQGQSSALLHSMSAAHVSATVPFKTSTSSSLFRRGLSMSAHEHTVTSSSSYPQVTLSQQSVSLADRDILQ